MDSSPSSNEIPSPSTLGRLIASYVQQSTEQHEIRAHKALSILQQKDVQLQYLQDRIVELEERKVKMYQHQCSGQNEVAAQEKTGHGSNCKQMDQNTRRLDQQQRSKNVRIAREERDVNNNKSTLSYPTRQIKSNVENVSEGSTRISTCYSEETKSQPNLPLPHWQKSATNAFLSDQHVVPETCARGVVTQKIQFYEKPGCGDFAAHRDTWNHNAQNADTVEHGQLLDNPGSRCKRLPSHAQYVEGIPRLVLPPTPGTENEGVGFGGSKKRREGFDTIMAGVNVTAPDGATVQDLADNYVKQFLDVKLMEASIICQEMRRDAPRSLETGKSAPTETSVLYSKQNSRKNVEESSSSETVDTLRSRSLESLKVTGRTRHLSTGLDGAAPRPEHHEHHEHQRQLIDHLLVYNRELKAELASLETKTVEERDLHLAEVNKLQQYVLDLRRTTAISSSDGSGNFRNAKVQTKETAAAGVDKKSALFPRNMSSQTEVAERVYQDEGTDGEGSAETSRTTQTEGGFVRECFCCGLGDSEVPPQWLLAEALAHAKKNYAAVGAALLLDQQEPQKNQIAFSVQLKDAFSATDETSMKVVSTQVDLSDSKAKDDMIESQEKLISTLKRQIEELNQDLVKLNETSTRKLEKEREVHHRIQIDMEKKMLDFCKIVGGIHGGEEMQDEKFGESSAGNSSGELRKTPRHKVGGVKTVKAGLRWDLIAMRRYIKTLKIKLRTMRTNYDVATQRIEAYERTITQNLETQKTMEMCVEELVAEVAKLRGRCQAGGSTESRVCTLGAEDGVGDGTGPVDKGDNSRCPNVHTRLRNANQQLTARAKAVQNLQQELREAQENLQNVKNRLSRSETLNQNKQLIIDNYKRRLDEIVTKEVATANRNSGLTTENHHLKDVTNSLKKQISQLQCGKSVCVPITAGKGIGLKVNENKPSEKFSSNRSQEDSRTQMDVERERCDLINQMELANSKLKKSEHRASEFLKTLERFLELIQTHFEAEDRERRAPDDATTASRLEARALACSILNLTHGQLDSMLLDSGPTGCDGANSKLAKWLDECRRLHSSEDFSEKLSCYLLDILKELTTSNRG